MDLKQKTMTTREIAEYLKTRSNVITENAKKCLPNKVIKNGVTTYFNEKEVTVLLEFMKHHSNRNDLTTYKTGLIGAKTNLSDDFDFFKLQQQKDLIQKQLDEYRDKRIKELTTQNKQLCAELGKEKEYRSIKSVAMQTGKYFSYKDLVKYSKKYGYEIHKAFDQNYGEVNTYHIDVWQRVYGLEL